MEGAPRDAQAREAAAAAGLVNGLYYCFTRAGGAPILPFLARVLVTGAAGFIGSTLVDALIERGDDVVGVDNFDPHYDPGIKRRNLAGALAQPAFTLVESDICDAASMEAAFRRARPEVVVHLAAAVGGRLSWDRPERYHRVNIIGLQNVLEGCRSHPPRKVVFTSTSNVYALDPRPCAEKDAADALPNPYAVSKRAGELLTGVYARAFGIPTVVLRLFTVYGPRQRPEMGVATFIRAIAEGRDVTLFGDGSDGRDYVFIGDCVQGILAAMELRCEYEAINVGSGRTTSLNQLVRIIGRALGREPRINYGAHPRGDPPALAADTTKAAALLGFHARTAIEEGIARTVGEGRHD